MHSKGGRWSRMYQDYRDLLSAFHAHGVKYLIVGGYAVIFHAQPRFTKDIDLFIKADPANRKHSLGNHFTDDRWGAIFENERRNRRWSLPMPPGMFLLP